MINEEDDDDDDEDDDDEDDDNDDDDVDDDDDCEELCCTDRCQTRFALWEEESLVWISAFLILRFLPTPPSTVKEKRKTCFRDTFFGDTFFEYFDQRY